MFLAPSCLAIFIDDKSFIVDRNNRRLSLFHSIRVGHAHTNQPVEEEGVRYCAKDN
jgi:hypothetical protein